MRATEEDLITMGALVEELCGIVLDQTKGYLIEHRFAELVRAYDCSSFTELAKRVRAASNPELKSKLIDAITTNETLFFRDGSPFEALAHKALPELIDAKQRSGNRRIRIWSAACSTGQEPYTIAMVLHDLLGDELDEFDIKILATDISEDAIGKASRGVYSAFEIGRGLPQRQLAKYFEMVDGGHRVADELRGLVSYQRLNLLESFTQLGKQDIVLCRNVAIYFQRAARNDLYRRIQQQMNPGGYLFVGSGETLTELGEGFEPHNHCNAVFYRPSGL